MDPHHDDLLKPTLRPGLDTTRFERPWNPSSLVYIAFFGGIAGGGSLFALNAKRLGMNEEVRRIVIGTIALTLISTLVLAWVLAQSGMEGRSNVRLARFGFLIVAILLAKWIARRQQPSFEAYDYSDRPKGKLWPYGIAAVLFGMFVHGVLAFAAVMLIKAAQGDPQ
jgi:hypothetical protein